MLMRLAGLAVVAAVLLPGLPAPAAATPDTPARMLTTTQEVTVPVTAEAYGAPGSLIPVVVRLQGASATTRADLELATPGVVTSCVGKPWFDRARHALSRTCFARMPAHRSHVHLRGYAHVRA